MQIGGNVIKKSETRNTPLGAIVKLTAAKVLIRNLSYRFKDLFMLDNTNYGCYRARRY